jgi:hypothetical protein
MSYRAAKRDYEGAHPETVDDRMQCMVCKSLTAPSVLSTYGMRCFGCFKAFCNAPLPPQKLWTGRMPGQTITFDIPEAP